MTSLQTITLPEMEEIILGFEGTRSAAVILMKYTDDTHVKNNQSWQTLFYVNNTLGHRSYSEAGCRVERGPRSIHGRATLGF